MAQEPRAPWSRWDAPGAAQYVPSVNSNRGFGTGGQQYDIPGYVLPLIDSSTSSSQRLVGATLVGKEYNAYDPSFYNCIYGIPNGVDQIIQQCHIDIGCCDTTCCENNWRTKYGWALALLCLFCTLVVISVLVWLVFWLINRSRDKRQRRLLLESAQGMTPASSHVNITPYATSGYPAPGSSPAPFYPYPRKQY